ncbi:MAG: hypothetical protein LBL82_00265 [Oscillospiraceae bacterium]|jgi:hypothetical protein|nr:hypothetical protein [Oscillospiraceae bacterium]
MTAQELKEALLNQSPVVFNPLSHGNYETKLHYACVSAIIYRADKNKRVHISAELLDKNLNSVIIVGDIKQIQHEGVGIK